MGTNDLRKFRSLARVGFTLVEVMVSIALMNVNNSANRSSVLQLKMNDLRNQFSSEDDGATQTQIQEQW